MPIFFRRRPAAAAASLFVLMFLLTSSAMALDDGIVTEIEVRGNRRIPADTIRSRMFTRAGDVYDQSGAERDFMALWNTGYFDDLRFEREENVKGWILRVYVKEKPTIREIKYVGLNSISQSDVLDKFKERKVGLSVESQFDPTRVKRAEVVLKDLLAAHGRQFASISTEVRQIPPAAVSVTFTIKEGAKVKVGQIRLEGSEHVSNRYLRASMKNLRPIGIPHSIFLENLLSKTYDSTKLEEDAERLRFALQDRGYFKAIVRDPKASMRDVSHIRWYYPLKKSNGKVVDITVPIEEGDRYRLKQITFTGNKAITNTEALRRVFKLKDGDWFNRTAIGKGLEELRKVYGSFGYINFTSVPDTSVDEERKLVTLTIDIDEGKPFYVRRIEFSGNTTTRDKVIRRELALEEGAIYNSQLWELSLLRLNQLNYFEPLKPEQDSETSQNQQEHTVDLTLKVKEKGKNSIGLTGGLSAASGSSIGMNYETNNFLGLGDTLSIQASVGTQATTGSIGFTRPYWFDRPLQAGFTVFTSRYNYNQARQYKEQTGQDLVTTESTQNLLQNYTQSTTGFTASASYPLHRSFKRLGLTYSFDVSTTKTYTEASRQFFEQIAFRNVSGPSALKGVVTSKVIPSYSFSTIDNATRPHSGMSFYAATEIAGLGGDVRSIRPIVEFKKFKPVNKGRNTIGYRLQSSFLTGWGGRVPNPAERTYLGGETDIRGFDQKSLSPYAFLVNATAITLQTPSGTSVPLNPDKTGLGYITIPVPTYQMTTTGGDTSVVGNFEYRIPIAGPVVLAAFADAGVNGVLRKSELRLSDQQYGLLNATLFGCSSLSSTFVCEGSRTMQFSRNLTIASGTNMVPRMSTGLELQATLPVVNAPLRLYWAYNPVRMDTYIAFPGGITRDMFPAGGAGDYTYQQALATYGTGYRLREPRKTFRISIGTSF